MSRALVGLAVCGALACGDTAVPSGGGDGAAPDAARDTAALDATAPDRGDGARGDGTLPVDAASDPGGPDRAPDRSGPAPGPECTGNASACRLHSDCCTCIGLGPGESPPACHIQTCFADACTTLGVQDAACAAGRCVAGFTCDPAQVACDALPPPCPPGQVASVRNGCWGSCVPARECLSVGSCAACAAGDLCVGFSALRRPQYSCVPAPPACGGDATCSCFGPTVCTGIFRTCSPGPAPAAVTCSCIAC